MFDWYERSAVCFVYLEDIRGYGHDRFDESRWFTRGWTLQELLAPRKVDFYDDEWTFIGGRQSLADKIARATLIDDYGTWATDDLEYSHVGCIKSFSVARRMSWASFRRTTKPEDAAYCLLGIFKVNMPLLYGEGLTKAFRRLQEEIMKTSSDHSLLAWGFDPTELGIDLNSVPYHTRDYATDHGRDGSPLANDPLEFRWSGDVVPVTNWGPWSITSQGIQITLPVPYVASYQKYAILGCQKLSKKDDLIAWHISTWESDRGSKSETPRYQLERVAKMLPLAKCLDTTETALTIGLEIKQYNWESPSNEECEFLCLKLSDQFEDSAILIHDNDTGNYIRGERERKDGDQFWFRFEDGPIPKRIIILVRLKDPNQLVWGCWEEGGNYSGIIRHLHRDQSSRWRHKSLRQAAAYRELNFRKLFSGIDKLSLQANTDFDDWGYFYICGEYKNFVHRKYKLFEIGYKRADKDAHLGNRQRNDEAFEVAKDFFESCCGD